MNILLTNDDGIEAKGIQILAEILKKWGHNIYMVAPISERSAASHSITIREPLRIKQYDENAWGVSGTPVDCVLMAFEHFLVGKPDIDLVISGINAGQNIGDDILYSGTVGAAVEAMCMGYKAIAVSITSYENQKFETAATIMAQLLDKKIHELIGYRHVLNVNVPNVSLNEIKGFKICKTGFRRYQNILHHHKDHRSRDIFWIGGDDPVWDLYHEDIDGVAVENNFVAISPLKIDYNDNDMLASYQNFLINNKFNKD